MDTVRSLVRGTSSSARRALVSINPAPPLRSSLARSVVYAPLTPHGARRRSSPPPGRASSRPGTHQSIARRARPPRCTRPRAPSTRTSSRACPRPRPPRRRRRRGDRRRGASPRPVRSSARAAAPAAAPRALPLSLPRTSSPARAPVRPSGPSCTPSSTAWASVRWIPRTFAPSPPPLRRARGRPPEPGVFRVACPAVHKLSVCHPGPQRPPSRRRLRHLHQGRAQGAHPNFVEQCRAAVDGKKTVVLIDVKGGDCGVAPAREGSGVLDVTDSQALRAAYELSQAGFRDVRYARGGLPGAIDRGDMPYESGEVGDFLGVARRGQSGAEETVDVFAPSAGPDEPAGRGWTGGDLRARRRRVLRRGGVGTWAAENVPAACSFLPVCL